jgi:luciferase family oxidoreductase group 1
MYKLSILEQSIAEKDVSNERILQQSVALAQKAEEWGYHRFWVSEHHASDEVLGSSPEILVSYILAKTKTIRVGSGGVLLQHYSPYKVAENFQVAATLEPGRVDLGIGKGPGGFPLSTKALQFGQVNDGKDFQERFQFLLQLLRDEVPATSPFAKLKATPKPAISQEIILLGTSAESATYAATQNVTYAFGTTFTPDETIWKAASEAFHAVNATGKLIFAIAVVVADSKEEAERMAIKRDIVKVYLANGRVVTLLDELSAKKFGEESGIPYEIKVFPSKLVAGTQEQVKKELDEIAERYQVDEFLIQTPVASYEERVKSLQALSEIQQNASLQLL